MVVGVVVTIVSVDVLSSVVDIKLVNVDTRVVLADIQISDPPGFVERLTDMSKLRWSSGYSWSWSLLELHNVPD